MNNALKFCIIILAIFALAYVKISFFPSSIQPKVKKPPKEEKRLVVPTVDEIRKNEETVDVYFLSQNLNNEDIYKVVTRVCPKGQSSIVIAIKELVEGPTKQEKNNGVYSEIPTGTKVLAVSEKADKVIINLSNEFEMGGGTDTLYKRLYQLIKTANMNTKLPVYLYLNGKKVEVIGGEGLMIKQPLNEDSFDD